MGQAILLAVPCFRESARLPKFLPDLCTAIADSGLPIQVQPVDDGSGDDEQKFLKQYIDEQRATFSHLSPAHLLDNNVGKGGAVYAGWSNAKEETHLAFVDADGAVPAEEVVRLCETALEGGNRAKCVYATRIGGEGTVVQRTLVRKFSGWIFATLVQFLYSLPFRDTQCGFKIVPRAAYERIRDRTRENRFCFDIEVTSLLIQSGTEVLAIPINWSEKPGSTLKVGNVASMFLSVIRLRQRLRRALVNGRE